jgi:hypothetical protein
MMRIAGVKRGVLMQEKGVPYSVSGVSAGAKRTIRLTASLVKVARRYPGEQVCARIMWLPLNELLHMNQQQLTYYTLVSGGPDTTEAAAECVLATNAVSSVLDLRQW